MSELLNAWANEWTRINYQHNDIGCSNGAHSSKCWTTAQGEISKKYQRQKKGSFYDSGETDYLTLPYANIYTYFSLRAKCWLRGGVGGQFPRNFIMIQNNSVSTYLSTLGTRGFSLNQFLIVSGVPRSTQQDFTLGGSAPLSNSLSLYIPFSQKRHPFRIPSIEKWYPFATLSRRMHPFKLLQLHRLLNVNKSLT